MSHNVDGKDLNATQAYDGVDAKPKRRQQREDAKAFKDALDPRRHVRTVAKSFV